MAEYKVVLQVESDYTETELRAVLDRLFKVPEASFKDCGTFRASVLALAETQASRSASGRPSSVD